MRPGNHRRLISELQRLARNTFATIHPSSIAHNLERVREICGAARVMAVVKADAYGHGLERCLAALSGADLLAVATMDEARAIRARSADVPVLLLEGIVASSEIDPVREMNLEMVVHHPTQLEWLEAARTQVPGRIWLKLDTGMHRLGFPPERTQELRDRLLALPGASEVVLMSHFACADDPDHPQTQRQLQRFDAATAGLAGPHCLANSAAILNFPDARRDWVRAGLLLYGVSPLANRDAAELGLRPAMKLETRLIAVNRVPAGESIGYGARFTAARDMVVGVAAIGYGDGYPRNMPDGTPVRVNGREHPLAGRVSMDMITIDLSDQPGAAVGDPVTLWGEDLPVERIARAVGTIPYELLCRVTRRVRYR